MTWEQANPPQLRRHRNDGAATLTALYSGAVMVSWEPAKSGAAAGVRVVGEVSADAPR
jgi:hypothetical protein